MDRRGRSDAMAFCDVERGFPDLSGVRRQAKSLAAGDMT